MSASCDAKLTSMEPSPDPDAVFERVMLDEQSWVDVARGWMTGSDVLFRHLHDNVAWQSSQLFRYDHHVDEKRLGAGWRRGQPLPHPALATATRAIQSRYGVMFDGFSMILYRDGNDGQGFHRDTDMRYLDDTLIAVLSLGAKRPWLVRPHRAKHSLAAAGGATHDFAPGPGDLLVMGGRAQADWQHSVAYLNRATVGPRVSLQWRHARRVGRPYVGAGYNAPLHYSQRSIGHAGPG